MKATSATGNADVSAPMLQYARWWYWMTHHFIWPGVVRISWMVAVILLNAEQDSEKKENNKENERWRCWPLGRCFNIERALPTMAKNAINLTTWFKPLLVAWRMPHGWCRLIIDDDSLLCRRARWWASGGCSDGGGEASGIIHRQWAVERLPEWRLIIAIVFLVRGVFGVREYAPAFPWWECLCLCRLFVEINGKGLSNLIYIHKSFILCKSFQGESVFLICLYFPVFFPHKPLLSIYYFG